jgi:hypothetical protein
MLDMGEDEPEPSDPSGSDIVLDSLAQTPHRWAAALPNPSSPAVFHGRSGLLSSNIPVAFQPPNASFWERCSVRYLDRAAMSARREQAASAPGCPEWGRPVLRKVMQVARAMTWTYLICIDLHPSHHILYFYYWSLHTADIAILGEPVRFKTKSENNSAC